MSGLGSIISHPFNSKASAAEIRAKRFEKKLRIHNAGIQRRQFLRTFRAAQATNLSQAGATAGGIDSSAFKGTEASLLTQRNVAVADALTSGEFVNRIEFEREQAARAVKLGQSAGAAGDFVGAIGGGV